MSRQAEPDNLISYLELHADDVRTYCKLVRDISSLAEQIAPSKTSDEKLIQQLQAKLPILQAHQAWLHGLLEYLGHQDTPNQLGRLPQRPDQ